MAPWGQQLPPSPLRTPWKMQVANDHLLVAVAVHVQPTRPEAVSDNPTMRSYTTCGKGLLTRGAEHVVMCGYQYLTAHSQSYRWSSMV